jgi:hypothetical protein
MVKCNDFAEMMKDLKRAKSQARLIFPVREQALSRGDTLSCIRDIPSRILAGKQAKLTEVLVDVLSPYK